jgi:hypothetical protein
MYIPDLVGGYFSPALLEPAENTEKKYNIV